MLTLLLLFTTAFAELHNMRVKANEQFKIELKANPSTGYRWTMLPVEEIENPVAELIDQHFVAGTRSFTSGPRLVGVGGTATFTFKANHAGTCEFKFIYSRPWEKVEVTPEVYKITVE